MWPVILLKFKFVLRYLKIHNYYFKKSFYLKWIKWFNNKETQTNSVICKEMNTDDDAKNTVCKSLPLLKRLLSENGLLKND